MTARKTPKPADYTHSVWSGHKYDRPQTMQEMVAESMAVLKRHPTISKCLVERKS